MFLNMWYEIRWNPHHETFGRRNASIGFARLMPWRRVPRGSLQLVGGALACQMRIVLVLGATFVLYSLLASWEAALSDADIEIMSVPSGE